MNKRTVTNIIIKEYREFTESVAIDGGQEYSHEAIVAKEVEAVIQTDDDMVFSLGFSIMRDHEGFGFESPRRIVQNFLINNFNFNIDIQE